MCLIWVLWLLFYLRAPFKYPFILMVSFCLLLWNVYLLGIWIIPLSSNWYPFDWISVHYDSEYRLLVTNGSHSIAVTPLKWMCRFGLYPWIIKNGKSLRRSFCSNFSKFDQHIRLVFSTESLDHEWITTILLQEQIKRILVIVGSSIYVRVNVLMDEGFDTRTGKPTVEYKKLCARNIQSIVHYSLSQLYVMGCSDGSSNVYF